MNLNYLNFQKSVDIKAENIKAMDINYTKP